MQDIKNFGILQSAAYLVYHLFKNIGLYRLLTPRKRVSSIPVKVEISPFIFPDEAVLEQVSDQDHIKTVAERILKGEFLAFGTSWDPLVFLETNSGLHWSRAKTNPAVEDIKLIWEPARFDWSVWLAKAYYLTKNESYFQGFKKYVQEFMKRNPVNSGLNWQSGQEIAIRFINLSISFSLFNNSIDSDFAFKEQFIGYLQEHAKRIRSTLLYAYAQNNNHLISEAVGLITASVFFKKDDNIRKLKKTGEFWLNYCLQHQFDNQGVYLQHSTNYHRMVLDLLMWVHFLENQTGETYIYPQHLKVIKKASEWLYFNSDSLSGEMANYGHNDGAYLFQFSTADYRDARPILQAICGAYKFSPYFEQGKYDEKSHWFNFNTPQKSQNPNFLPDFRLSDEKSWAVLRVNQFTSRPGQADQNHVDLWYAGVNVVCDAGTYSYNLPEPWHNALRKTKVHNTVVVDEMDQMEQFGTFRWRNWSCGEIVPDFQNKTLTGKHDGFNKLGITHTRKLTNLGNNCWQVDDTLSNKNADLAAHEYFIHWLIKENNYQVVAPNQFIFTFSKFQLFLELTCQQGQVELGIGQAGKCIYGDFPADPNLGWYSPSYLVKYPALSITGKINSQEKLIQFTTNFRFVDC